MNLISRFNQPDVHIVISEWPERVKSGGSYHGVAAYTRETLLTLARTRNQRFVVFAEKRKNNEPQLLSHGKILVLRIFEQKRHRLYPTILTWLAKFPRVHSVTVHSEFGSYKGIKHFILLIPFLALIKAVGRHVTYFAHNVIENIDSIKPQLMFTPRPWVVHVLNRGIGIYYRCLKYVTSAVVVLDQHAYDVLSAYIPSGKLYYFPHWVKSRTTAWTKISSRKILGIDSREKVIMAFGFISWYKGSDILASLFADGQYKTRVLFVGGKHPILDATPKYEAFYSQFTRSISQNHRTTVTGFVPEQNLGLYFAAADLVVLPYRQLMGGSGAFSYALSYKKPVLLSDQMTRILDNHDVSTSLKQAGLKPDVIFFPLSRTGMVKIVNTMSDRKKLAAIGRFSSMLAGKREISRITGITFNTLYRDTLVKEKNYARTIPYTLVPVYNQAES